MGVQVAQSTFDADLHVTEGSYPRDSRIAILASFDRDFTQLASFLCVDKKVESRCVREFGQRGVVNEPQALVVAFYPKPSR